MPRLESAIKEALRLHPPLILVLRVAKEELEVEGFRIAPGKLVGASPAVSNRIAEDFPDPDAFVPERYLEPRAEDRANPWTWIPFGAGRHRCVGAPFAMMQLKAIFSVLLRRLGVRAGPAVGDLPQRPLEDGRAAGRSPCAVRYRRRSIGGERARRRDGGRSSTATCARATGCASPRPRRCSRCRRRACSTILDESPPEERCGPRSRPP